MATSTLCKEQAIDLVYICTDWLSHVPIAVYAMEQDKCVAVEVPAALTLKDIWALVDTAERTQKTLHDARKCSVRPF